MTEAIPLISSIVNHARRERGVKSDNPVRLIRKPATLRGRSRVITLSEHLKLLDILSPRPTRRVSPWANPLVEFALETTVRRGELLALRQADIDDDTRVACLLDTQNGDDRSVPLSSAAVTILRQLPVSTCGRVFPLKPQTVAAAFKKATQRADWAGKLGQATAAPSPAAIAWFSNGAHPIARSR